MGPKITGNELCARGYGTATGYGFLGDDDPAKITELLQPIPTAAELWASRRRRLEMGECKLGELCWLATVSRPDSRARPAQLAPKVESF